MIEDHWDDVYVHTAVGVNAVFLEDSLVMLIDLDIDRLDHV